MSRHSHSDRSHSRHRAWRLSRRIRFLCLALPGAFALAAFIWESPGGPVVVGAVLALSALLALAGLSWVAGRSAAAVYNFSRFCSARSGLEKIMREHRGLHRV